MRLRVPAGLLWLAASSAGCGAGGMDAELADESGGVYAASDLAVAFLETAPTADDRYTLLIGASAATRDVVFCQAATAVECGTGATSLTDARLAYEKNGRRVFRADASIKLERGLTLALNAYDTSGRRTVSLVRFAQAGDAEPDPRPTVPTLAPVPSRYLPLSGVHELIRGWAAAAPDLLQASTFATINGQDAVYLKIGKAGRGAVPKALVTAATHGDEKLSTATLLGAVHALLSQYGRDARVTELLDSRDVYVVPVLCADGYTANRREVDGNVDPNRSFPSPVAPNRAPTRCADAARRLFLDVGFHATLDYHAFGRMTMYPWSHTRSPLPAEQNRKYRDLAQRMAAQAGYRFGQIPELVGLAEGSSGDYFHWQGNEILSLGTAALAIEVGEQKAPDPRAIAPEAQRNVELLKTFLRDAPDLFRRR